MVAVDSLFIGSDPGKPHIVFFPCQTPTALARNSCIFPGVAATMHACRSACVQPGGSFTSPCGGLASFAGSAFAEGATNIIMPRATINERMGNFLQHI